MWANPAVFCSKCSRGRAGSWAREVDGDSENQGYLGQGGKGTETEQDTGYPPLPRVMERRPMGPRHACERQALAFPSPFPASAHTALGSVIDLDLGSSYI